ncbi:MAG: putative membrane protein YpjA, partial [Natrialbaceae archaeon]
GFHPLPLSDPLIVDQFAMEPVAMWPLVPDSPAATLFIALAIAGWKLDWNAEWLGALAFFGCLKLGAWTPYTLLAFDDAFSFLHVAMYNFLFWSHLAMVLEGFVLYRLYDFPVRAVAVAAGWYLLNDVVDYFIPVLGDPHHTIIPAEYRGGVLDHTVAAHDVAAAGAVTLTVLATFFALATRVKKLETGAIDRN